MKFFWKSGFGLLFNWEVIEIQADIHCQSCFSGKDIMLKTAQPFFKSSYELHLNDELPSGSLVLGGFSIEKP